MNLLVACSCGSPLHVPAHLAAAGKTFRCPRCKTIVGRGAIAKALGAGAPTGTSPIEYDDLEVLPDDYPLDALKQRKKMPRLLEPQKFLIKGKGGFFHSGLDYNIFDFENQTKIGVATEETEIWAAMLKPFMRKRYLPTRIEIRDQRSDKLVFGIHRPAYFWNPRVEVCDADDRLIGYFAMPGFFSLLTSFRSLLSHLKTAFSVYDWRDREFAVVSWERFPVHLTFRRKGRGVLGSVMKEVWATRKMVVSSGQGGSYVVTMAPEMKQEAEAKMLLLGTAVALDVFGIFEKAMGMDRSKMEPGIRIGL